MSDSLAAPTQLAQSAQEETANAPAALPTPEPRLPADVHWKCQTLSLGPDGKAAGPIREKLTVGVKFLLECEGEPIALAKESLRLDLPKAEKYALRLLETRSLGETSGSFIATTWMTGDIDLKDVIVTDGEKRLGLDGVALKSETVITPENNPESKAFGPWGPIGMSWPLYVWLLLAAVLLWVVLVFGRVWWRARQRKRLLRELARHNTALTPFNQFSKDLRLLSRSYPGALGGGAWGGEESKKYFTDLNEAFRWFLAREFLVPAFDFSTSRILKEIRRSQPGLLLRDKLIAKDLRLCLTELEKALSSSSKSPVASEDAKRIVSEDAQRIVSEDAQQITELCRKLADRVAKARSA